MAKRERRNIPGTGIYIETSVDAGGKPERTINAGTNGVRHIVRAISHGGARNVYIKGEILSGKMYAEYDLIGVGDFDTRAQHSWTKTMPSVQTLWSESNCPMAFPKGGGDSRVACSEVFFQDTSPPTSPREDAAARGLALPIELRVQVV